MVLESIKESNLLHKSIELGRSSKFLLSIRRGCSFKKSIDEKARNQMVGLRRKKFYLNLTVNKPITD